MHVVHCQRRPRAGPCGAYMLPRAGLIVTCGLVGREGSPVF